MTHGSLFSGIGGFDLAAEWMGWQNLFHCELNEFGKKVLHYYWPNAEQFTDITKSDFTKYANKIDILTGGFPCQPYSMAGKRKGKEDERHLWPEMLRAIKEIQPRWVVGENVFGLVNWSKGLVFHEVQADLEAAGYEVQPFILPAAAVNAPHRRDRVWFVAYSRLQRQTERQQQPMGFEQLCKEQSTADTKSKENRQQQTKDSEQSNRQSANNGKDGDVADTNGIGLRRESNRIGESGFIGKNKPPNDWQNFPTEPPVCNGDDGIPSRLDGITFSKWRNESIKAAGNAIVPQVALQIFKAIQEFELLQLK